MPGFIPDHVLDQIRQANDVVEVVGSYFPLKRKGAGYWACCPFHKEKTPSFQVNQQKQIWHCFGCGAGGDVFGFLMKYENLPFVDAVRRLAERAHIALEYAEPAGGPTRDEKDALYKLHEAVAGFFHQNLLTDKAAAPGREYLKKRQIPVEVIKRWRLGFAPDAWDGLIQWAKTKKFSPELLEAGGLALRGDRGLYDRFRGRMTIPICDDQGRVVGFSARILTDAKDQPKYINSPETPIFQKGRLLFALDKAKRSILDDKFAILCEGQLDTIACHEAGFTNVIAPQGTAFTEQHARILKRHTDEVVLMFDGDEAGQNAAVRNAEPLWELGIILRVALLPEGHDPDSFLKQHGAEKLRELLNGAPGFFDFLLQWLSRQFDARTERGKMQIAEQMIPWLCRIHDPILQATFVQRTAARLDVREEVVRQAMKNLTRHGPRPREEAEEADAAEAPRPVGLPGEQALLQLMLGDERVIEMVAERLERDWLSDSVAAELIVKALDRHSRGQWNGPASLLNQTGDDEGNRLVSELLLQAQPKGEVAIATGECLATLERRWLEQQAALIRKRLSQADLPAAEMVQLQQQVLDLRRKMDNIPALQNNTMRSPRHPAR